MSDRLFTHCLLRNGNRFQYAWIETELARRGATLPDGWQVEQAWQTVPARRIALVYSAQKERAATVK